MQMSSCKNPDYGCELRLLLSSPDSNYPNLPAETAHFHLKLKSWDRSAFLSYPTRGSALM